MSDDHEVSGPVAIVGGTLIGLIVAGLIYWWATTLGAKP